MNRFELFQDGIYRLKVPFEDIYTSVFALVTSNGSIIFDTATTESDVDDYIIPAINSLGIKPDYIICSHTHCDHFGGVWHLSKVFPNAIIGLNDKNLKFKDYKIQYLNDGDVLLDRFKVLNLKGHTKDSISLYDLKNKSLISVDCLQLNGVSKYGTGVTNFNDYKITLERVKALDLNCIIASHDFVPLGATAVGSKAVREYINECENAVENIRNFANERSMLSNKEIAAEYNRQSNLPPISYVTVESIRNQS